MLNKMLKIVLSLTLLVGFAGLAQAEMTGKGGRLS